MQGLIFETSIWLLAGSLLSKTTFMAVAHGMGGHPIQSALLSRHAEEQRGGAITIRARERRRGRWCRHRSCRRRRRRGIVDAHLPPDDLERLEHLPAWAERRGTLHFEPRGPARPSRPFPSSSFLRNSACTCVARACASTQARRSSFFAPSFASPEDFPPSGPLPAPSDHPPDRSLLLRGSLEFMPPCGPPNAPRLPEPG